MNVSLHPSYRFVFNVYVSQIDSDHSFSRSQTLQDISDIIKIYPSFGKDASSVLIALGEAMRANARIVETNVLIKNAVARKPMCGIHHYRCAFKHD